jgi:hypothetical protein
MSSVKNFNKFVNESRESDQLAKDINTAIVNIDDSMSYKDFAAAVANVILNEYGSHLKAKFVEELRRNLKV